MVLLSGGFRHALVISVFVFAMMVLVDYLNVMSRGKMSLAIRGGRRRQYVATAFLGATPGCLGAFLNVSFYLRGLITFGAIVGGMVATSGDEAFVMLAMFPRTALLLFGILFVLGIFLGWLSDLIAPILGIKVSKVCDVKPLHDADECRYFDRNAILGNLSRPSTSRLAMVAVALLSIYGVAAGHIGPETWNWMSYTIVILLSALLFVIVTVPEHYLREHLWQHIFKRHLWRVFLWSFFAIAIIDIGLQYWSIGDFVATHMVWVLLIAALVAVVPESGPHLIFVAMFAEGLIPFSVLLTSSIVQDGHGMLPLLSHSVQDTVRIKLFNLVFGLIVGGLVYVAGF